MRNARQFAITLLAVLFAAANTGMAKPTTQPALSRDGDVLNFSLLSYRGQHYELRRVDAKLLVLFFTSPGCPIAKQQTPKLQALAEAYRAKGVAVWMINSMPQSDPSDTTLDMMFEFGRIAPRSLMGDHYVVQGMRGLLNDEVLGDKETLRQETRDHIWGAPPIPVVLKDTEQAVSRYFEVNRTCDTLLIDTERRAVIYRGSIDDQFGEGKRRPKPLNNFLRDAIDQYLAGQAIERPATTPHGCEITYEFGENEDAPVSYTKTVGPILRANCVSCHSAGNIGPFALDSYSAAKSWSAMTREVLLDRRMPPWHADPQFGHFTNDRSMSAADKTALLNWIKQGSPNDNGPDPLAVPAKATPDWELGTPDLIARLPKQTIPATGVVDYRFVDSDFVMPYDAWLSAVLTKPGNRQVTHHIIVRVKYPNGAKERPAEAFLFTTWVPGLPHVPMPKDTGMFLPKGARLNFEIHYTTNGTPQVDDQTAVGMYLAKEKPLMRFEVRGFESRDLDIPPGVANAKHTINYNFKRDTLLYAMTPHMHVRGSWFRYDLLTPDGERETLCSVPAYDFNWQTNYILKEPKLIPAGSWMQCTGGFDNSIRNLANPDPTAQVRWGPQSWNEMFMGFMDVAELPDKAAEAAAEANSTYGRAEVQRVVTPNRRE